MSGWKLLYWYDSNTEDIIHQYKDHMDAVQELAKKVLDLGKESDTKWINSFTAVCNAQWEFI